MMRVLVRSMIMTMIIVIGFSAGFTGVGTAYAETPVPIKTGPLTAEEVQEPIIITDPTGRVTFEIKVVEELGYDGACRITDTNGFQNLPDFRRVDSGSLDGVVCSNQQIRYNISYNVQPSETETRLRFDNTTILYTAEGRAIDRSINPDVLSVDSNGGRFGFVDFSKFLNGGTGFAHTGTGTTMIFPPSTESISVNGGDFVGRLDSNWVSRGIGFYVSPMITITNLNNTSQKVVSDRLANPTYITGTATISPILDEVANSGRFYVDPETNEGFFERKIRLTVKSRIHEALNLFHSWNFNIGGEINIDFSDLPEGTIIEPESKFFKMNDKVAVLNEDTLRIGGIINSEAEKSVGVNSETFASNGNFDFTLKIPLSNIEDNYNLYLPHISLWNVKPAPYHLEQKLPFGEDSFLDERFEVLGVREGMSVNTEQYFLGNRIQEKKTTRYKNGDINYNGTIAPLQIERESAHTYFKEEYMDLDGKPDYSNNIRDKQLYYNKEFWSVLGANANSVNFNNQMYCDYFNSYEKKIDTNRKIIVEKYVNGSMIENYDNVRIRYGKHNLNTAISNSIHTPTLARANCNSIEEWTDAPTDETNLVRVDFIGEYNALSPNGYYPHRISIPFVFADEEILTEKTNYPNKVDVYNRMYAGDDKFSGTIVDRKVGLQGIRVRYTIDSRNYIYNAGTVQEYYLGSITALLFKEQGSLDGSEVIKPGTVRFEIPSFVSQIDYDNWRNGDPFTEYDGWVMTDITRPDWGPDGLPGTEDDVSGWVLEFKYNNDITYDENNWSPSNEAFRKNTKVMPRVSFHIPPYMKDGEKYTAFRSTDFDKMNSYLLDKGSATRTTENITTSSNAMYSQTILPEDPSIISGEDVSWRVVWDSNNTNNMGETNLYGILPYNNDPNGTKLDTPLSNVRFDTSMADTDVEIYVTDADPTTITKEKISNSEIKMVPLSEAHTLSGEITAFQIKEATLDAETMKNVRITASTEGNTDGTIVKANLLEGEIFGIDLPMPETTPVTTRIYETKIEGTVWFDIDKNNTIDEKETRRFENVEITLQDTEGNIVATTTTNEEGYYLFEDHPAGEYTVSVGEVPEYVNTITNTKQVSLTEFETHETIDFGKWRELSDPVFNKEWVEGENYFLLTVENNTEMESKPVITRDVMYYTTGGTMPTAFNDDFIQITDNTVGIVDGSNWDIPILAPGEKATARVYFDTNILNPYIQVYNTFGVLNDCSPNNTTTETSCVSAVPIIEPVSPELDLSLPVIIKAGL